MLPDGLCKLHSINGNVIILNVEMMKANSTMFSVVAAPVRGENISNALLPMYKVTICYTTAAYSLYCFKSTWIVVGAC